MNLNKKSILFISLLFSSLLVFNFTNIISKEILKEENSNYFLIKNLRTSQEKKPIAYEDISCNTTEIKRFYETINISLININEFDDPNNLDIYANISFTNNSLVNYSMFIDNILNIAYYNFTPTINAPLGLQNVTFSIFNNSGQDLLNNQTTKTNFTISNNLPYCSVYLSSTKIYRNEFLMINLTPSDVEDNLLELNWSISIVDYNDNKIKSIGSNLLNFIQKIDDDFIKVNSYYRIKVNITDTDKHHSVHYFPFEVINSPPQIVISPINTIIITPDDRGVKRSSELVKITLNVTDIEDSSPSDVDVKLKIEDTNGVEEQLDFTNNGDGSYELEFNITA